MATLTQAAGLRTEALELARKNLQSEPSLEAIYWFPHETELRLVEAYDDVPPTLDGVARAFYWRGTGTDAGKEIWTAIALMQPEEIGRLKLPEGWGGWEDAERIDGEMR